MKDNRLFLILIALILIFSFLAITLYASNELAPRVSAKSCALYEPESETFIYKKDFNQRLPMASTTKIMTALVVLDNLSSDEFVEVDKRAVGTDGSSVYLEEGEIMTTGDLLYALMLASANDAAEALAYHISGSIEDFSLLMNEKARSLGANDTFFKNPHGLDAKGHFTTAHDLAIISAEALKNEFIKAITSTYKRTIYSNIKERVVVNHNKLLKMIDGCIGVKTGYTQLSGRSLVGACERDGLTLISVTIDAPDDWRDHKALFDYGFSKMHASVLLGKGDYKRKIPVINSDYGYLTVENEESIKIIYEGKKPTVKRQVYLPHYLIAPISSGDQVGKIVYTVDDKVIGEIPLIAKEEIKETKKSRFFERFFAKEN